LPFGEEEEDPFYLYKIILEQELKIPEGFSDEFSKDMEDIIHKLL